MSDDPVIEVQGLTKSAGPVRILNGIDLEVGRGEVFGLLGPIGAGKTTLLHCLLDLVRPMGGGSGSWGWTPGVRGWLCGARSAICPAVSGWRRT